MHHWLASSLDSSWIKDGCGYFAGSLVLGTFSVTSMRRLRLLGIASNLSFITYAIMAGMAPILILHSLLLPVNIYRLIQLQRARRSAPHRDRPNRTGSYPTPTPTPRNTRSGSAALPFTPSEANG